MGAAKVSIKRGDRVKIQDFGQFDGPLVLFGGPYSNLQALEAMVAVANGRTAICTGDVVAYGANPSATVALMRDTGWPVVAGNCERQVARGADDCGCGFGEDSACDILSRGWYPHALAGCDTAARSWMASLPDIGVLRHGERRYGVIHGGATSINRFLWPSTDDATFRAEIAALQDLVGPLDGVVSGHSGIAFHRRIDRHSWINAGVIGLPPHDGRPMTRYAILDQGDVVIHRLDYDHHAARARMEQADLTQGYHETLSTGLWPSQDILPANLRR